MKRYYLSKINLVDIPGFGPSWEHRFQTICREQGLNLEFAGGQILGSGPTDTPVHPAILILVDTVDHRIFAADAEIADFPDGGLDAKISAIGVAARNRARDKAARVGFSAQQIDSVWNGADDLRAVIDHYGRLNNPTFDSRNFDVRS